MILFHLVSISDVIGYLEGSYSYRHNRTHTKIRDAIESGSIEELGCWKSFIAGSIVVSSARCWKNCLLYPHLCVFFCVFFFNQLKLQTGRFEKLYNKRVFFLLFYKISRIIVYLPSLMNLVICSINCFDHSNGYKKF